MNIHINSAMYIHIWICCAPLTLAASAMASSFLIATITSCDDPPVMLMWAILRLYLGGDFPYL